MYALVDAEGSSDPPFQDPVEKEIHEIEELRRRTLENRDILYCSAAARHLIETEIPRLIDLIRRLRRAAGDSVRASLPEHG